MPLNAAVKLPPIRTTRNPARGGTRGAMLDQLTVRTVTKPLPSNSPTAANKTDPKVIASLSKLATNGKDTTDIARTTETRERRQYNETVRERAQERSANGSLGREILAILDKIKDGVFRLGNVAGGGLFGGAGGIDIDLPGRRRTSRTRRGGSPRLRDKTSGRFLARGGAAGAALNVASTVADAAPLAKGAGKFGKFARLGGSVLGKVALPIAAAFALADAVQGIQNSDALLGKKSTNMDKIGVGVTEAINGALFGLPDMISEQVFGRGFTKGVNDLITGVGSDSKNMIAHHLNSAQNLFKEGAAASLALFAKASEGVMGWFSGINTRVQAIIAAVQSGRWGQVAGLVADIVKYSPMGVAVTAVTTAAPVVAAAAGAVGERVATAATVNAENLTQTTKEVIGKTTGSTRDAYFKQRESLHRNADTFGLNRNALSAAVAQESSFNPNIKAGTSSATGTFQFLADTWVSQVGKTINHPKAPAEIKAFKGDFDSKGKWRHKEDLSSRGAFLANPKTAQGKALLALRKNGNVSNFMGAAFTADNNKGLRTSGIPDTPGNTYLAHFLGLGGVRTLFKASDNASAASIMPAAAKSNKSVFYSATGRALTVREIKQWAADKMGRRTGQVEAYEKGASTYRYSQTVTTAMPASKAPAATPTATVQASAPTQMLPTSKTQTVNGVTSTTVTAPPSAPATPMMTAAASAPVDATVTQNVTGQAAPTMQAPAARSAPRGRASVDTAVLMPILKPVVAPQAPAPVVIQQAAAPAPTAQAAPATSGKTQIVSSGGSLPALDSIPITPSLELLAVASLAFHPA